MTKKRTGVMVGGYVATKIKADLVALARKHHWTLTQLLVRIFLYALKHPEIVKDEDCNE
jgi:hypothetical protein